MYLRCVHNVVLTVDCHFKNTTIHSLYYYTEEYCYHVLNILERDFLCMCSFEINFQWHCTVEEFLSVI